MLRNIRRYTLPVLFIAPLMGAVLWSSYPALQATAGGLVLRQQFGSNPAEWWKKGDVGLKRSIQQHFSSYETYIPVEDVHILDDGAQEQERLAFLLHRACGPGKLFVWVPLRFRIPVLGSRVFEWCLSLNQK